MRTKLSTKLLTVLLAVGLLVTFTPVFGFSFAGGVGSSGNPFQITDWHHLNEIRNHLSSHFILMNNLDVGTDGYATHVTPPGGAGWLPIGTDAAQFTGNFNGQGFEIRDLFIYRPSQNSVGLFGVVGSGGVISNVGVVDVKVTGQNVVGSLVGSNSGTINNSSSNGNVRGPRDVGGLVGANNGTINNSSATGSVTGVTTTSVTVGGLVGFNVGDVTNSSSTASVTGIDHVGGLVGVNRYLGNVILNSYALGNVTGRRNVGGLVGWNDGNGSVSNSFANGRVTATQWNIGGLVGQNAGTVSSSYATGSVSGSSSIGGLVGWNLGGTVSNSYATGLVTGTANIGGLVGRGGALVTNSFWDTQTSGRTTSAGGTGMTTEQMSTLTTFLVPAWSIVAVAPGARDDTHIWNIVDGVTHPFLSWQPVNYSLSISSTPGGNVTMPGMGTFTFARTKVNLVATPHAGFGFFNWTGDVGAIANVNAANTTIRMDGNYTVTANFATAFNLTMAAAPAGGGSTTPTGKTTVELGAFVNIIAAANPGFRFINWTAPAGTFGDATVANTTFSMPPANVTVTANFECMFATGAITLYGAQDEASKYGGVWSNNSNRGYGFLPWKLDSLFSYPLSFAGTEIADPSFSGISGMDAQSFVVYAGSIGALAWAEAIRQFKNPLPVGTTFSFDWRPILFNYMHGLSYFGLYAGSPYNPINVIDLAKSYPGIVRIRGNPMFTQPGNYPLRLQFTYVAEGLMRVKGTGMNGTEKFNQTFTVSITPNHFVFAVKAYTYTSPSAMGIAVGYFSNLQISTGTAGVLPTSSVQIRGRVLLDENITTGNLLIDPGHMLHVNPQRQITVNNLLRNLGGTGGLFLRSNAAGAGATLLHNTDGIFAAMERVFSGARQWRLLSSAVASQAITGPWTPAAPNHGYDFYAWDEPAATWRNQKVEENNITHFVPGRGYLVSFEAADLIQYFTGPLNNGNITVPVVRQNTGPFAGANLLGNPYPSAIDWHLADRTLFTDHFAYVYDRVATGHGTTEGFFPVNGAVAGALIAPNQGFFVLKRNPGTASFTFTNAMRTHGGVFKSDPAHERIILNLSHSGWFDQTEINNKPGSTPVREANDALKFFSYNNLMPQIYSLSSDGIRLAINSAGEINQESEFRIGIKAPAAGQYTLQVEGLANAFAGLPVFLRDLITGAVHNLRENPRISFQSPKTEPTDRFVLSFVQPTHVGDLPADATRIFYANGMLHLQFAREDNNRQLQVIDLTGRVVLIKSLHGMGTSITVPLQAEPGAYIVRITGDGTAVSQRILVR